MALLPVLVFSVVGCSLLDPSGTALREAEALYEKGEAAAAVLAYEGVVADYAGTDAAGAAAIQLHHARLAMADSVEPEEALRLTRTVVDHGTGSAKALAQQQLPGRYKSVVDSLVSTGRHWEAGQVVAGVRGMPAVTAAITSSVATITDEPAFDLSKKWGESEGFEPAERVALASEIYALGGPPAEAVGPYLASNVSAVLGPRCAAELKGIGSLEDLAALKATCETIVVHDADSATGQQALVVLEQVPVRDGEIRRSPGFRTEAALQECRAFQSWVRGQKRAGNITALQRGVEGARGQRYQRAIEYLQERMFSLSSQDAQYRLARRIQGACGG